MPRGYAPFGIQEINGLLYVTYALQDAAKHDDVPGPGRGFVDIFTTDGLFVKRLVSRGVLNAPWGLAQAPAGFGSFGGDLLVGNFGNGRINAFNPITGHFAGTLSSAHGKPISIDGLWGLHFGTVTTGGTNMLLFSAGPNNENDGLIGLINPAEQRGHAGVTAGTVLWCVLGAAMRGNSSQLQVDNLFSSTYS